MIRAAILVLASLGAVTLWAQDRTVRVSASETVMVPPESGALQIAIDLQQYHEANEVAALQASGVAAKLVSGSQFSTFWFVFDGSVPLAATYQLEVRDSLGQLATTIKRLQSAQADLTRQLGPFTYRAELSDVAAGPASLQQAQEEAYARLELVARRKAEALARVAGLRLGDALSRLERPGLESRGDIVPAVRWFDVITFSPVSRDASFGTRYTFTLSVEYAAE